VKKKVVVEGQGPKLQERPGLGKLFHLLAVIGGKSLNMLLQ
jgi:hypothetical protein